MSGLYVAVAALFPASAFGFGNQAPIIDSLSVSPTPVPALGLATITCSAHDPDGSVVRMKITVSDGTLPNGTTGDYPAISPGPSVTGLIDWNTPAPGTYQVTCGVQDSGGLFGGARTAFRTIDVEITAPVGRAPVIDSLVASETAVFPNKLVTILATAHDPDGDPITYFWSATCGVLVDTGAEATWTAPAETGACTVTLRVRDPGGLEASAPLVLEVVWARAGDPIGSGAPGAFYPERIAFDGDGNIYVSEPRARAIIAFTPRGDRLRTQVVDGRPAGVAVDAAGALYVGDLDHGRVVVYDALGLPVGELGAGAGEFKAPTDIAVDASSGLVWVADVKLDVVRAYDGTRERVVEIPLSGSPGGVAVDPATGFLYVTDIGRGQVTVFDSSGIPAGSLGEFGSGPGQLTRPGGVFVAADGHVYVVDAFQSRVAVFDPNGFVTFVARHGSAPGRLRVPVDAAIGPFGRLVVSNTNNGRLDVFDLEEGLPPSCEGDADCDGMPDDFEVANGFDPNSAADAWLDADGDGLSNIAEYELGTDPHSADTDGDGASDLDEILEGTDPLDPTDQLWADAGADFSIAPARIALDGSGSRVAGASELVFDWSQVGGPELVALQDAASVSPWFVALRAGEYVFRLRVSDGVEWSPDDFVAVTVLDVPPTADAGPNIGAQPRKLAVLDGRFSSDANGDEIGFAWAQVAGPTVALSDSHDAQPEFTPEATGTYAFDLVVSDGTQESLPDRVWVNVDARTDHVPVAGGPSFVIGVEGEEVLLDGTESADADGDPLAYAWTQTAGPAVLLSGAGDAIASFVAGPPDVYRFELVASAGGHESVPHEAVVAIHDALGVAPMALAVPEVRAEVLDEVVLPCEAVGVEPTCAWEQVEGVRVVVEVFGSGLRLYPLESGTYQFERQAWDEGGAGDRDRVVLVVDDPAGNTVPVAVAELRPEALFAGHPVTLHGQASFDSSPEAHLDFIWSQVRGPRIMLNHVYSRKATGKALLAGDYAYELRASDGIDRSPPARIEFRVAPQNPAGQ